MGRNWHHGSLLTLLEMVENLFCPVSSSSPETPDWDAFELSWPQQGTFATCIQMSLPCQVPAPRGGIGHDTEDQLEESCYPVILFFLSVWPQKGAFVSLTFSFAFLQGIPQNPLPISQGCCEASSRSRGWSSQRSTLHRKKIKKVRVAVILETHETRIKASGKQQREKNDEWVTGRK